MRYTIWSRGRLVGESDLGYRQWRPNLRGGDFFPSDEGLKLMPIATESPTLARELSSDRETEDEATFYADVMAAEDRFEALSLELHDSDGRVIATKWIGLSDTELVLSFLSDHDEEDFTIGDDPELEAQIQHDAELVSEWFENASDDDLDFDGSCDWMGEPDFPRYQIFVELRDPTAVG